MAVAESHGELEKGAAYLLKKLKINKNDKFIEWRWYRGFSPFVDELVVIF
ncbi:MAG: hypothetical protein Q4A87_03340 [Streptococcus sp.]|nr:hypothetical protein [Streptococcus sp.]